ncbi:HAD family hydrolase [Actinopolymorpha pittospori]
MTRSRQVLIFDADDTLWENNLLYERVIEDFLDWLAHPTLDRAELRTMVEDVDAANAVAHGYGSRVFLRSLGQCLERLRARPATVAEQGQIEELAAALVEHKVELLPGVAETLDDLARRHDLRLLTKGDPEEQQRKIDASNLAHHFQGVHIVPEKRADTYRQLAAEHALMPSATWMIGNSPKSDINPARAAGMNAVFIPNPHTWALEHDDVDPTDAQVLRLRAFPDLRTHF